MSRKWRLCVKRKDHEIVALKKISIPSIGCGGKKSQAVCALCDQVKECVRHHISYKPPKILYVCKECHEYIHNDKFREKALAYKPHPSYIEKATKLKPNIKRSKLESQKGLYKDLRWERAELVTQYYFTEEHPEGTLTPPESLRPEEL